VDHVLIHGSNGAHAHAKFRDEAQMTRKQNPQPKTEVLDPHKMEDGNTAIAYALYGAIMGNWEAWI